MIDLEAALAPLVERAPEPPAVDGVARRGRQRRRRRHGVAFATAAIVLAVALGTAAVIVSGPSTPKVAGRNDRSAGRVAPLLEHPRITLLDGSQLDIQGLNALGLTNAEPSFNAELYATAGPDAGASHSFTVQRTQPVETGRVVSRLSNLTLYETDGGVDAVMQFGDWWLVNSWGQGATHWARFDDALRLVETPNGYLAYQNDDMDEYNSDHWRLGPTDAPDLQLADAAGNPSISFFGPSTYPAGCPRASSTKVRTAQGWPVSLANGAWWCDANAHVRVHVSDPRLVDNAMKNLRVSYTDADHAQQQLTALDGTRYEVTAPKDAFNQFHPHATLTVAGIATRYPLTVSVGREEGSLPNPGPRYRTADGTRMYTQSDDDQLSELVGIYGPWILDVSVFGLSEHDLTRVASLIRAHETTDGFLVLDPVAPMRFKAGSSAFALEGVGVTLGSDGSVHVAAAANRPNFAGRTLPNISDRVHVRRIG